jgi:hypothetical protein
MAVQTDLFTVTMQHISQSMAYLWQSYIQKIFYFAHFINTIIAAIIYFATSLHALALCSASSDEGIDPWGR